MGVLDDGLVAPLAGSHVEGGASGRVGLGGVDGGLHVEQAGDHRFRPGLGMLFTDEGPFAQGMGIAPSVVAWAAEGRFLKVVDRAPEEAGEDVEGMDGLRAALGVAIVGGAGGGRGLAGTGRVSEKL